MSRDLSSMTSESDSIDTHIAFVCLLVKALKLIITFKLYKTSFIFAQMKALPDKG